MFDSLKKALGFKGNDPSRHNIPNSTPQRLMLDAAKGAFVTPAHMQKLINKRKALHVSPLAAYLNQHVKEGDLVADVGCSSHPVSAASEIRERIRAIGIDGSGTEDVLRHRKAYLEGTDFHYQDCDLNDLHPGIGLDPETVSRECREKMKALWAFVGRSPAETNGKVNADMLLMSRILPYIEWDKPFDFLLDHVRPGGLIVMAGIPDDTFYYYDDPKRTYKGYGEGRSLRDMEGYLRDEGMEVELRKLTSKITSGKIKKRTSTGKGFSPTAEDVFVRHHINNPPLACGARTSKKWRKRKRAKAKNAGIRYGTLPLEGSEKFKHTLVGGKLWVEPRRSPDGRILLPLAQNQVLVVRKPE